MDKYEDKVRRRYIEADYQSDKEILDVEHNIILHDDTSEPIEERRSFIKWLLGNANYGHCHD